jgi:uncharacterized protein
MSDNLPDIKQVSPYDSGTQSNPTTLVQITVPSNRWVPSRYNSRTTAPDGRIVLWNSQTGAISVFGKEQKQELDKLLSQEGIANPVSGLANYLKERNFLVPQGADEYRQFQWHFGRQHYRTDMLELILLASEDCNFRCKYCYEEFKRGTMEPGVRKGLKQLVLKRIESLRQFGVAWFGGEPLYGFPAIEELAPFFAQVAEDRGLVFNSSITTNGYLLTPDVAEKLLRWKITNYQITIDGAAETHDCNRPARDGSPTFYKIFNNLLSLQSRDEQFLVRVRVNFDSENYEHIEPFLELLSEKFAGDTRFVVAFHRVSKWGGDNDQNLLVCGFSESHKIKAGLESRAAAHGLKIETLADHNQMGASACIAARPYNIIVGADGKIMKCTIALDKDPSNIVGRIDENGELNLNDENFARWTEPAFEKDAACQTCHLLPTCQGISCPLVRFKKHTSPCETTMKYNLHNELISVLESKPGAGRRITINK